MPQAARCALSEAKLASTSGLDTGVTSSWRIPRSARPRAQASAASSVSFVRTPWTLGVPGGSWGNGPWSAGTGSGGRVIGGRGGGTKAKSTFVRVACSAAMSTSHSLTVTAQELAPPAVTQVSGRSFLSW